MSESETLYGKKLYLKLYTLGNFLYKKFKKRQNQYGDDAVAKAVLMFCLHLYYGYRICQGVLGCTLHMCFTISKCGFV